MKILWLLAALVVAFAIYVRVAPVRTADWHVPPVGDESGADGFAIVRDVAGRSEDVLQAVMRVALATPRTRLIAGDVDEGMMTFQTRSRVMGFPDYTTMMMRDGRLIIYARLRFGQSDLGVNRARVEDWLDQLGPLVSKG